jgi:hypothetical protein
VNASNIFPALGVYLNMSFSFSGSFRFIQALPIRLIDWEQSNRAAFIYLWGETLPRGRVAFPPACFASDGKRKTARR